MPEDILSRIAGLWRGKEAKRQQRDVLDLPDLSDVSLTLQVCRLLWDPEELASAGFAVLARSKKSDTVQWVVCSHPGSPPGRAFIGFGSKLPIFETLLERNACTPIETLSGSKVHAGLYITIQSELKHLEKTLQGVSAAFSSPPCHLIFTGHGIGGGQALLAFLELLSAEPSGGGRRGGGWGVANSEAILFGAPPVYLCSCEEGILRDSRRLRMDRAEAYLPRSLQAGGDGDGGVGVATASPSGPPAQFGGGGGFETPSPKVTNFVSNFDIVPRVLSLRTPSVTEGRLPEGGDAKNQADIALLAKALDSSVIQETEPELYKKFGVQHFVAEQSRSPAFAEARCFPGASGPIFYDFCGRSDSTPGGSVVGDRRSNVAGFVRTERFLHMGTVIPFQLLLGGAGGARPAGEEEPPPHSQRQRLSFSALRRDSAGSPLNLTASQLFKNFFPLRSGEACPEVFVLEMLRDHSFIEVYHTAIRLLISTGWCCLPSPERNTHPASRQSPGGVSRRGSGSGSSRRSSISSAGAIGSGGSPPGPSFAGGPAAASPPPPPPRCSVANRTRRPLKVMLSGVQSGSRPSSSSSSTSTSSPTPPLGAPGVLGVGVVCDGPSSSSSSSSPPVSPNPGEQGRVLEGNGVGVGVGVAGPAGRKPGSEGDVLGVEEPGGGARGRLSPPPSSAAVVETSVYYTHAVSTLAPEGSAAFPCPAGSGVVVVLPPGSEGSVLVSSEGVERAVRLDLTLRVLQACTTPPSLAQNAFLFTPRNTPGIAAQPPLPPTTADPSTSRSGLILEALPVEALYLPDFFPPTLEALGGFSPGGGGPVGSQGGEGAGSALSRRNVMQDIYDITVRNLLETLEGAGGKRVAASLPRHRASGEMVAVFKHLTGDASRACAVVSHSEVPSVDCSGCGGGASVWPISGAYPVGIYLTFSLQTGRGPQVHNRLILCPLDPSRATEAYNLNNLADALLLETTKAALPGSGAFTGGAVLLRFKGTAPAARGGWGSGGCGDPPSHHACLGSTRFFFVKIAFRTTDVAAAFYAHAMYFLKRPAAGRSGGASSISPTGGGGGAASCDYGQFEAILSEDAVLQAVHSPEVADPSETTLLLPHVGDGESGAGEARCEVESSALLGPLVWRYGSEGERQRKPLRCLVHEPPELGAAASPAVKHRWLLLHHMALYLASECRAPTWKVEIPDQSHAPVSAPLFVGK